MIAIPWLLASLQLKGATVRQDASGTDGREALVEDHYFLNSIEADAKRFGAVVRNHWSVETLPLDP